MNILTCVLGVSVGLGLGASQALAGLRGSPNLAELAAAADTIVVATVADDAVVLPASHSVSLTLLVDRVLKGSEQGSTGLPVVWTPKETFFTLNVKYIPGTRGLFFVSRTSTSQWRLISVIGSDERFEEMLFPAVPGPIDARYSYSAGAPVLEKVLLELGAALEPATPLQRSSLQFLHWTPMDKSLDPVAQRIYNNWAACADGNIKMFGLAGLVRLENGAALAQAARTVQTLGSHTPQVWVLALAVKEYFRSGSPSDLSTLAGLTGNGPVEVRRAAAYALAAIHSRKSLPFLASLLDSDDADIRSFAVGGLGMFANQVPMLTTTTYPNTGMKPQAGDAPYRTEDTIKHFTMGAGNMRSNESYYVSFWKTWWKQHEAQLVK